MQTNSSAQQPSQTYFLQRPKSPNNIVPILSNKNNTLALSIGANQSSSQLVPPHKFKIAEIAGKGTRSPPELQPPTL